MNKRWSVSGLLWILIGYSSFLCAQTTTNSPYSGFGLGDLNRPLLSRNSAMGGIGVGISDKFTINRMNPASYSDLWRFTADVSAFYQSVLFQTATDKNRLETGGFQGLSLVFKKSKPFAIAIGMQPYSTVGYESIQFRQLVSGGDTLDYYSRRSGSGGLNDVYLGVSGRLFKRKLGLGLNTQYIFGKVESGWETSLSTDLAPPRTFAQRRFNGFGLQLGVQYGDTLRSIDSSLVWRAGLTVDLVPAMNARSNVVAETYYPFGETAIYLRDTLQSNRDTSLTMPVQYGFGVSLGKLDKFTIGIDFLTQDWSSYRYFQTEPLGRNTRITLGGEWIPDITSYKRFFSRIAYRIGGYYDHSYITVRGTTINTMGFTAGLGIPLGPTNFSRFNIGFEWNQRGTTNNNLIQETGYRLILGISFVEPWFNPRKYD